MNTMAPPARPAPAVRMRPKPDALGLVFGLGACAALLGLSFVSAKASRIASGQALGLFVSLPLPIALGTVGLVVLAAASAGALRGARWRLASALVALLALALSLGLAADHLTPLGNRTVRIAPGAGYWVATLCLSLIATDAIARAKPGPVRRVVLLCLAFAVVAALFALGVFDHLSVMREYATNASTFWREVRTHLALSLGSVAVALALGLPLGVLCHRHPPLGEGILKTLNFIQTVPSLALFGILMVPLGWLASTVPAVGALGIHGIGRAPAAIALVLYALLPIVANTALGLGRVSQSAVLAARGMGYTPSQVLWGIEAPLAAPVILAGIRIVLVQNIGLATIAALIGGGGLGTFVFQGVGQTAVDLVLLGAIPTVAMAFAASVVLDALIEGLMRTTR